MSCMPRSADNQIPETWPAILESQGIAEVEGWCNEQCFLRVSASLWQDGAGCRGNGAGSQEQPVPSASATSACPFPPRAEDSDYTAIPGAVLAHLWFHDLKAMSWWEIKRVDQKAFKSCDSSAFKLYFLLVHWELLFPSVWYCFDLCVQCYGLIWL